MTKHIVAIYGQNVLLWDILLSLGARFWPANAVAQVQRDTGTPDLDQTLNQAMERMI
jgi:hypothetical protein